MKNILSSLLPGRATQQNASSTTKRINLALQGGGAHGAFTWGVLEQLLGDDRIAIEGISGTSAGAVNAVMLADGLTRGGRDEAQKRLAEFWRAVSSTGGLPALQRAVTERLLSFTRSKARRCRPGSLRCRAIFRPTTSIRSTSIR
jgi:NTE family protein